MKRSYILVCFIFFNSAYLNAQSHEIDSLKRLLSETTVDTTRTNLLNDLSSRYLEHDSKKATEYANQALTLARKSGYVKGQGFAHKGIARSYMVEAKYAEALEEYKKSLAAFESIGFKKNVANILNNIGVVYFNMGLNEQAIEHHLKSLKISEEIKDRMRIATSLNNIGGIYSSNPSTIDNALRYYQRALPIFIELSYDYGAGTIAANISEIYLGKNQYDSTIKYSEISIKYYRESIDATYPLYILGVTYSNKEDYQSALKYQNRAVEIAQKEKAPLELAQSLLGLGAIKLKQNKIDDAISTYLEVESIARRIKARKELKSAYEQLSKMYALKEDYKNAYLFETRSTLMKDTIGAADARNNLERVQFMVELQRKKADSLQAQIARLDSINSARKSTTVKPGQYFALIIGVSEYLDQKLNLDRPVEDARKLKTLLESEYTFDSDKIKLLINPTRQQIFEELYRYRKTISSNDNLLIFYAGHGFWDKDASQGYWWPRDASSDNPASWLSNSDLRDQIRSIKSGHTLLVSDACFSGGIFKTRGVGDIKSAPLDIVSLYKIRSRRAITSGNLTDVPDQSVFFSYLTERLKRNEEKYYPSQKLFENLRSAVINNTMTLPQDGVIADTGDEGGDFIFIRKDK